MLTHSDTYPDCTATIQNTYSSAGKLYAVPPGLVSEHRILLSSSDLFQSFQCCFQKCAILSVISPFLSYDIQLCHYYPLMIIWQLIPHVQITSSHWLCYIAPKIYFLQTVPNNHTNCVPFPLVMRSISIWTDTHLFYWGPCRWHGGRHCELLAQSETCHPSPLGRWLMPLQTAKEEKQLYKACYCYFKSSKMPANTNTMLHTVHLIHRTLQKADFAAVMRKVIP
jgi:hypothetical protein